jgi:hypothetical protein
MQPTLFDQGLELMLVGMGTVFVFVMASASNLLLVAAAVIYALFYFAAQPIQNYLLASYVPRQRQGLGYGIHFFLSFGVGSTAAPGSPRQRQNQQADE